MNPDKMKSEINKYVSLNMTQKKPHLGRLEKLSLLWLSSDKIFWETLPIGGWG